MMDSVAETALKYGRNPFTALRDLREAFERFEQTYHPTRVEKFWLPRTETWEKLWYERWEFVRDAFSDLTDAMQDCQRLEFVFRCIVLARKCEPELFGILAPVAQAADIVSWISEFIRVAYGRETFCIDGRYPLKGFEHTLDAFEHEILRSNRYVKPSTTNATSSEVDSALCDATPNPTLHAPTEDPKESDGIDESRMVFRWGGREVEGFTPTGFDVLNAMWRMLHNDKHSVRRADVATFLPQHMATWDYDPDLKSFSKYQTEIRKAFEAAGMARPWEYNPRTKCYLKSAVYRGVDGR